MTVEVMERTAAPDGERSVSAAAETWSETAGAAVGRAADPEVAQVAKRRKHSKAYKLQILEEIDNSPGKTGVILRREGLYSSYLTKWRKERDSMNTSSPNKRLHNELAKKDRDIQRLKLKLQKAEGLIELQKKTSEMLSLMSKNQDAES